jgi:predicted helicase
LLHLAIKPADKLIKGYYDVLGGLGQLNFDHEGAVRSAFQNVLAGYSKKLKWTLVPEYPMKGRFGRIAIDGALLDEWNFRHGFWEAKDMHDQLDREIRRKIEQGYPTNNTIFQMPERAILFQNGVCQGLNEDIREKKNLVELLKLFFAFREPDHEEWEAAVAEFEERIPELAGRAKQLIDVERKSNRAFRESFDAFYALCRQAINPNLSDAAVEEMLIQHLLTERIFRRVFHAEEFRSRNVIAAEIEKVITSMTSRHFSRDQFLSDLDRFYKAIERAAEDKDDYSDKQAFLNTVYERFFQGYSPKEADTHGIVYTPQPIVDFMVHSVEDILKKEFGRSLADKNVHILDPFVGTGNFITRVMRQIAETDKGALPYKYEHELHCNEVMLLPYYIASMNIEHEYLAQTGDYRPFDGICLVDTFDIRRQTETFAEENTRRIAEQNDCGIFVVIGNPPYNAWQITENDNNKNLKYPHLDALLVQSYVKSSAATNKNALWDMYVRAFRWASDRVGEEGLIMFVSNNGFIDGLAFDGMRKSLAGTFSSIYHLDLKGNARTAGERRKREGGNVFDNMIRVGVGITLLVKRKEENKAPATIYVHNIEDFLSSRRKQLYLDEVHSIYGIDWTVFRPERGSDWFTRADDDFRTFLLLGGTSSSSVFESHSNGVKTNRDKWTYGFQRDALKENVARTVEFYNAEVDRYARASTNTKKNVDDFVNYDESRISWSRDLKVDLTRGRTLTLNQANVRQALYKPFTTTHLYLDSVLNEEIYTIPTYFPNPNSPNQLLVVSAPGYRTGWSSLLVDRIPEQHLCASSDGVQCFPFYTYSEDGSNRHENITDWALEQFRSHYHDPSISKWDIFHYVYAVLHHPEYRSRYAANLKRELPRIPFLAGVAHAPSRVRASAAEADRVEQGFSPADQLAPIPSALAAEGNRVEQGFSPADQLISIPSALAAEVESRQGRQNLARHVSAGDTAIEPAESRQGRQNPARHVSAGSADLTSPESRRDDPLVAQGASPGNPANITPESRRDGATNPDAEIFRAFAAAGQRLAHIHVHYEQQPEYQLEKLWKPAAKLDYRVTKMRLSKDKSVLTYNDSLTLKGIPPETYEYRLGNRSALEWVIDQYQVSTDKRSGITNDPNRPDDREYILHLIGQVITVSLETVHIVNSLPEFVIETALAADQSG